jgi:hypothetical protein
MTVASGLGSGSGPPVQKLGAHWTSFFSDFAAGVRFVPSAGPMEPFLCWSPFGEAECH